MTVGEAMQARCTEEHRMTIGYADISLLKYAVKTLLLTVWPELFWAELIPEDSEEERLRVAVIHPLPKEDS